MKKAGHSRSPGKTGFRLALVVVAMFGFGFAMVPIYDVFCNITGLNGKNKNTTTAAKNVDYAVDESRIVKVQFMGTLNGSTRMDFRPEVFEMEVHPGKIYTTRFYARNPHSQPMVGQAIPSVQPSRASLHFHKTECFCFTQQEFAAREGREMPVSFVIDPGLPKDIETVTLSYTFFDITQTAKNSTPNKSPDGG